MFEETEHACNQCQEKTDEREHFKQRAIGQQVWQQHNQTGTNEGAPQAFASAEYHAQQQDHHQFPAETAGLQKLKIESVEPACQTTQTGTQCKSANLVAENANAHGIGGDGTVAQRFECPAPMRGQQILHGDPGQRQEHQTHPEKTFRAQMQPEQQRPINRQALRALSDTFQFVQSCCGQRGETERGQSELRPFKT